MRLKSGRGGGGRKRRRRVDGGGERRSSKQARSGSRRSIKSTHSLPTSLFLSLSLVPPSELRDAPDKLGHDTELLECGRGHFVKDTRRTARKKTRIVFYSSLAANEKNDASVRNKKNCLLFFPSLLRGSFFFVAAHFILVAFSMSSSDPYHLVRDDIQASVSLSAGERERERETRGTLLSLPATPWKTKKPLPSTVISAAPCPCLRSILI